MKKFSLTTGIPPLILIGTIIVLFPIFTYMTLDHLNRQKINNTRLLLEKSSALIRAFEAGANTGMMNMGWSREAMVNLLFETAALPDIDYLFLVNPQGRVMVHNRSGQVGTTYGKNLDLKAILESEQPGWRIVKQPDGHEVFEVYKKFSPINTRPGINSPISHMHTRMIESLNRHRQSFADTIIFVGLDISLIAQADKNDTRHTILMAAILAVIGFTGFVLVYILQRYTAARSTLSRIRIFSDTLVENMPVGLIAADMDNRVISVNPAAVQILGPNRTRGTKNNPDRLPEEIKALLLSKAVNTHPVEKEIEIKDENRSPLHLEVMASPLADNDKKFLGTLLILRDKTELNRLKQEMEQHRRLAAIGRLAAGVAHEIRNPLSSLKGYATFFKEVFEPDSENHGIADTMTKEVDRLNRVVGELVELAKPVAVSKKAIDIEALILKSTQQISYEPDAQGIEIKTDIAKDLPLLHADEDRLKQVLLNLYLNAVQAMDNSGTLSIRISTGADKKFICIIVSDTGKGIDPAELPSIFEPYFTTKLSGTGLGLAIVHNIIKAHNGEIDVDSSPENGTRFIIRLPSRT
jgi:two-component system sensor histidine kinase HydH